MQLMAIQPLREQNRLVGWTARFTDEGGRVRLANLGLGCLMNASAFTQAVARQGIRFTPPSTKHPGSWQAMVRRLTAS